MEFRHPKAAAEQNARTRKYLTESLSDTEKGKSTFEELQAKLGNAIESFPSWHPILTTPDQPARTFVSNLNQLEVYKGCDHTRNFVRGFVTCPYSEAVADKLVAAVNAVVGLSAYRLQSPLYSDSAYPVVVYAVSVETEADGTISSRDALSWFVQNEARSARTSEVAETWWTMRTNLLGSPHGSRSSLCVNQHTGSNIRKILEAMNASGMFGPLKEWSLDMLSEKKRAAINETLLRAALSQWKANPPPNEEEFCFNLRGETCRATVHDSFSDGTELSIRVWIGERNSHDLLASGHYASRYDRISASEPKGKQALAQKFI